MDATISIMWEDMETWADEVTRSRPRGWSAAMGLGLGMSFASSPRSATSFQTLWTQPLPCAQLPFSFSVLDVKWLWKGQPGTQVSGGSDGETQSSSWAVVPAPARVLGATSPRPILQGASGKMAHGDSVFESPASGNGP